MRAVAALALAALPATAAASGVPLVCIEGIRGAMYNTSALAGPPPEWQALTVFYRLQLPCRAGGLSTYAALPEGQRYVDFDPLLADLTGDGEPEILVVERGAQQGARLAVVARHLTSTRQIAATPYLGAGTWLAQIGALDLDGDGVPEIAAVERPHDAPVLRLWHLDGETLTEIAALPGVTVHRPGEPAIHGGFRACDGRPEIVAATPTVLVAIRLDGTTLTPRDLGPDTTPAAFAAAIACR